MALAVVLGLGVGVALSRRDVPAPDLVARVAQAPAARPAWFSDTPPTPQVPPVPAPTLAERLDRLGASRDPVDAYRAWWLLNTCMAWQRTGSLPHPATALDEQVAEPIPDPARFCGALTERMKMARIDYLERAARGGIDDALAPLVEEGPFGDPTALLSRPDDPLVKEWKERIAALLGQRAEQGSWAGMYLLFGGLLFENPAIAVTRQDAFAYGMAMRAIAIRFDDATEQTAFPFLPLLKSIGKDLTPAQVAQANAHAAAIVARARQRGQQ